MLDTQQSKWTAIKARMRYPRTHTSVLFEQFPSKHALSSGCVAIDTRIYIIGGWSGNSTLTECEVYDAVTQHLLPMAPLPLGLFTCLLWLLKTNSARSQAGVCAWRNAEGRNKILVAGGADRIGCTTTLFEYEYECRYGRTNMPISSYSIESDVWSQLPSMATPRRGCAAVVVNGKRVL